MQITEQAKDEELVTIIRESNKEYFAFIIDRYENKIKAYINRLTNPHDKEELNDLTQQVFIKTYTSLNKFEVDRKFSSWIYRIAHNLAVNWLKAKKANISIDENEFLANTLASIIDLKKEFLNKELKEDLHKAINKLPDKFKEPFILKYFEDKTYDEISDILRKPKNTIGTMIIRAKKRLKKELKLVL